MSEQRIWLINMGDGDQVCCDSPDPSHGIDVEDVTGPYILNADKRIAELEAENERLGHLIDDTKRLEFVIKNYMRVYSLDMSGKRTWSGVGRPIGNGTTPREAIDAAMEVEGEK